MTLSPKPEALIEPSEVTLELVPKSRVEVIDVKKELTEESPGFGEFPKAVYTSHHTTAGYLEQSICSRLNDSAESVESFVGAFQKLFPPEADYRHDAMELRSELSLEQRLVEPKNADSHLTYIGAGLQNCVTYENDPSRPVYFVELDGINGKLKRRRRTTVIGYNTESLVEQSEIVIPMADHPMDSVNLRDPRYGVFEHLSELLRKHGIRKGRIDLALATSEKHAGLTVNEYETLLMRHDLIEVLRNPMRFMAEKGYHMLRDPRAIPSKAKDYAKYDLVQLVNEVIDKFGLSESVIERILDKFLSVPASRFLRMKRSTSLLVSDGDHDDVGSIVQGKYQSPILVQWRKPETRDRILTVSLRRFE